MAQQITSADPVGDHHLGYALPSVTPSWGQSQALPPPLVFFLLQPQIQYLLCSEGSPVHCVKYQDPTPTISLLASPNILFILRKAPKSNPEL